MVAPPEGADLGVVLRRSREPERGLDPPLFASVPFSAGDQFEELPRECFSRTLFALGSGRRSGTNSKPRSSSRDRLSSNSVAFGSGGGGPSSEATLTDGGPDRKGDHADETEEKR